MERSKRRSNLLTVILWVTLIYFLVPLVWLAISSTKDNGDLFTTFGLWFGNSFQLFANVGSLFTLPGRHLLALGAEHGDLRDRQRGRRGHPGDRWPATPWPSTASAARTAVFSVILGAIMIPLTALALPTYLLFASANLTDTMWAVILPSLVSPFGVFLMRVYAADAVPDELIEAARIDGAGEFRIFATSGCV